MDQYHASSDGAHVFASLGVGLPLLMLARPRQLTQRRKEAP